MYFYQFDSEHQKTFIEKLESKDFLSMNNPFIDDEDEEN